MNSIILFENQYIHVLDKNNGKTTTVLGPCRYEPQSHHKITGPAKSVYVLSETEYCVICNPFDPEANSCVMGGRQVRTGPMSFPLHYGEYIEGSIAKIPILLPNESLIIEYQQSYNDKPSGFREKISGNESGLRYIPNKYVKIIRPVSPIRVTVNEGIYVVNNVTSDCRLIRGPKVVSLSVDEELFNKEYSHDEVIALGLPSSSSYRAHPIFLQNGEIMCVLDSINNTETIVMGPKVFLLGPKQSVKILSLSAGKPKKPNCIKVAKVRASHLSVDYMSDLIEVVTTDSANLRVRISYQWKFLIWDQETGASVFKINDFIGYACQSLCSGIREQAASCTFEDLHQNTVSILRNALFKDHKITGPDGKDMTVHGVFFPENRFLISELDIKSIEPINKDISRLLSSSIKTTMKLVCRKMEQSAQQAAEKEKIAAQGELERIRQDLIDIQNDNHRLKAVVSTRIKADTQIIAAKAKSDAAELNNQTKLNLVRDHLTKQMELLDSPGGQRYLEYLRIHNLGSMNQQWILPTNMNFNPLTFVSGEDTVDESTSSKPTTS